MASKEEKQPKTKLKLDALRAFLQQTEDLVVQKAQAAGATETPKTSDFVVYLIKQLTGKGLEGIPKEKRPEVVKQVVQVYLDFLEDYLFKAKGRAVYDKFKNASASGDTSISQRDPEIKAAIKEAHSRFLVTVDSKKAEISQKIQI